jgi:predicted MPP superfamily phosphohydrolase
MLVMQGYVSWHVWRVLPFSTPVKIFIVLLMFVALCCMVLQFKSDSLPLGMATAMYEIGNSWLVIAFYLLMAFLVLDIGRLVHLVPRSWLFHNGVTALAILGLMVAVFLYGNIHYKHKVRVPLELTTSKPLAKDYTIVMVSDLHIGYHNTRSELARWIDLINAEHPDLVLIAGDIIDMSMRPLKEERMAEEFRRLTAPVYACLGNHEYYSGEPDAQQFYHDAGIHLLRDSAAAVGDLCIIGRDDRTNMHRKSLGRIVKENELLISHSSFLILLDHQPYHLEQAEQHHVDFQFSGHTHHGQVWPISWITESIYECAFGSYQRGNTRYYISSGLGIWGGKFRIGTRSEYIVAEIKRQPKQQRQHN